VESTIDVEIVSPRLKKARAHELFINYPAGGGSCLLIIYSLLSVHKCNRPRAFHEIGGLPRRARKTFTEEFRVRHATCMNFGLAVNLFFPRETLL